MFGKLLSVFREASKAWCPPPRARILCATCEAFTASKQLPVVGVWCGHCAVQNREQTEIGHCARWRGRR